MAQSSLFSQIVNDGLAMNAGQEWKDVVLYTNNPNEQALLYEYSDSVAVQMFLRMAKLPYAVRQRPNVEFMSPTGKGPLLRVQNTLIAEFSNIVDYVEKKGITFTSHLTEAQVSDMLAHLALIDHTLRLVEMYISWKHDETYRQVTAPRYGCAYHWPLSSILPVMKRRQVIAQLDDAGWGDKTLTEVIEQADKVFRAMSLQLGEQTSLYDDALTQIDALLFGHLFTILTMRLPVMDLVNTLKKYPNLINFSKRMEEEIFKI